jgi:DNA-binding transcriptional MerR regulator
VAALIRSVVAVAPERGDDDVGEGALRPPLAAAQQQPQKSQAAFRTISEVAAELDVAQHVLRFWESKFPQVRPLKRGGGRRYYRPEDVELLRQIRALLYEEGYTIKGAQKLLRARRRPAPRRGRPAPPSPRRPSRHRQRRPAVRRRHLRQRRPRPPAIPSRPVWAANCAR